MFMETCDKGRDKTASNKIDAKVGRTSHMRRVACAAGYIADSVKLGFGIGSEGRKLAEADDSLGNCDDRKTYISQGTMSKELTKEQLIEYVKKQKVKIKKLETDLAEAVAKNVREQESKSPKTHAIDESKFAELQSELLSKDDEIESLSNELHESEAKFIRCKNEFDSTYSQWSNEKEFLSNKLKAAESEAVRVRELEEESIELRAKLQTIEIAEEQLIQMFKSLQKDFDEVLYQKDALNASEQHLLDANRHLQAMVDSLSEVSKSSDSQLSSLITDLKRQIEEITSENARLISTSESERKDFEVKNNELLEQLSNKSVEIFQLQEELSILNEKLAASGQQPSSNENSPETSNLIAELKLQIDELATENTRLMGLHEDEKEEVKVKAIEIIASSNEQLSIKDSEIARLQEEINALQAQFTEVDEKVLDSTTEEKLTFHVNELKLQIGELFAENSICKFTCEANKKEFDEKAKQIEAAYEEKLSKKDTEIAHLNKKITHFQDKPPHQPQQPTSDEHKQENRRHHHSSTATAVNEGMKTLEDKLHRMKTQYQTSLQRIKDIEGQVTEHEELHVSLHKQLDIATARIIELEEELAKERSELAGKLQEEQLKMRDIFTQHMDSAQKTAETMVQSLQSKLQTANASIDDLKLQFKKLEDEKLQLISEKDKVEVEMMQKIESLQEELRSLAENTNATATLSETLAYLRKQHESELEAHAAKEDTCLAKMVEMEENLAVLEKEKVVAKEKEEFLSARIAILEIEMQSLHNRLKDKEAIDATLAATSAKATANASELSEQLLNRNKDLEIIKKEVQEKDDKVKKAILKLKQKIKENDELSQQLESLKKEHVDLQAKLVLAEKQAQEYQVQVQVLRTEQESIVRRTQESEGNKSDFEHRLKAMNDALLTSEERLSAILLEKNKLRDELLQEEKTLSVFQSQCDVLKQEKDSQLRRIKELEKNEHDSVVRNNELQQLSETLKTSHALLTSEVTQLRQAHVNLTETDQELKQQLALSSKQTQLITELQEKMDKERAEFVSKEEALNERVKKLKGLLAKVNQASQEKDAKLSQLDLKRPKRFLVLAKITVKVTATSHKEEEEHWTMILPDVPQSSSTESETNGSVKKSQRWVEESTVQDWLAQGSSIIGTTPENITEQWFQRFQSMQTSLERERDNWKLQFEDISQQFNTYKVRAQTALKRIGTDDKERQSQKETEQREMDELRQVTTTVKRELSEQFVLVKEQDEEIGSLKATLSDAQEQIKQLEADIEHVQEQLQVLRGDNNSHQDTIQHLHHQLSQKDHELRCLQSTIETLSREVEESRVMTNHVSIAEPVWTVEALTSSTSNSNLASSQTNKAETFNSNKSDNLSSQPSLLGPSPSQSQWDGPEATSAAHSFQQHRPPALQATHVLSPPPATPTSNPSHVASPQHTNSKLLVHQQVDHLLRENIHILREENSALNLELLDLRNEMTLRDDQIAVLKSAVRELEASLLREQEFNASSRHVNAEYLVNVLRKFLMAVDASERFKLVGVLCQMLHLQPEETRLINERWAVRGGGLVGWLLPPKPVVSTSVPSHTSSGAAGQDHTNNGGKKQPVPAPALDQYSGMGINLNPY